MSFWLKVMRNNKHFELKYLSNISHDLALSIYKSYCPMFFMRCIKGIVLF